MGWQDRDYNRSGPPVGGFMGVLNWLMTGSVPLFRIVGIEVRMHAAFLVMLGLVFLFGFGPDTPLTLRVQFMVVLWGIVLLHEFGHCYGARLTGGSAELIMLNPLGGLAYSQSANNPSSRIWTVAGGPLVNVGICLITGTWIYFLTGDVLLTPGSFITHLPSARWIGVFDWLWVTHATSLALLFFNMLPIFPLDGGQLLQAILWRPLGQWRSMMIAVNVGLVGSVLMMLYALLGGGGFGGGIMLFIGLNCLLNCIQWRTMLKSVDPWAFDSEVTEDAATFDRTARRQAKLREASAKQRDKQRRAEKAEQANIDRILTKVSAGGMQSLSWMDKRALGKASQHQRQRASAKRRR